MLNLLDEGYSIEEIGEFLTARKELTSEKVILEEGRFDKSKVISLKKLAEFYETFGSGELDGEEIASEVGEVHAILAFEYFDTTIAVLLKRAKELGSNNLEFVVDSVNKKPMLSQKERVWSGTGYGFVDQVTEGVFGDSFDD